MTPVQLKYFNDMEPGESLSIQQVKNPIAFISAAKQYIDQYGLLQFNSDYTEVTKLNPIPKTDQITFYLQ
ncbi:hypothetical protein [Pedobacter nyackensis]|uniref:Uncharacterized protein n=1 Tax=Pedobacter nyackensis TaxID=475255 RepID=A0A1W1ZW51_9SPHI|nr:hypothetical protein [Pedobacter nyackensis]SMC52650.1 hypothetical protein SAMN04488101_101101 [Pedobacter nyackensis]